MKIDATNNVFESQPSARPDPADKSAVSDRAKSAPPATSEAERTSVGSTTEHLKAELNRLPEIRQDRIETLQKAIRDGTYNPTDQQIAGAMMRDLFGPTKE